jgi:hypothetical protein
MRNLPPWVIEDPHALMQLLRDGEFTLHDEDTPP